MELSAREMMEFEVRDLLKECVSDCYNERILCHEVSNDDGDVVVTVMDLIIADIVETSGYVDEGEWSISDVRYAIGRVLCDLIGAEE